MPPEGFEPAIPASKRPHTHALDHAATGIGAYKTLETVKICVYVCVCVCARINVQ
jgi:hypothetical protein